jgi:AI-2 transport protein TqsA
MSLTTRGVDAAKLAPFDVFPPKSIIALVGGMLGAVAGAMGNGLVLLLVTIFALIELVTLQTRFNAGEFPEDSMMHRFEEISQDTRKYVAITGVVGLVQAAINSGVLMALGVDFAVTFGVFFFFCNFIPAVGFFIAIVPPFFITLLDHGLTRALYVLAGWWIVNFIFDNIIRPKFMKKGLHIPIFMIIAGLIVWAWVLGPVGAILAVPLTMAVIRLVQYAGKATQAHPRNVSEK